MTAPASIARRKIAPVKQRTPYDEYVESMLECEDEIASGELPAAAESRRHRVTESPDDE